MSQIIQTLPTTNLLFPVPICCILKPWCQLWLAWGMPFKCNQIFQIKWKFKFTRRFSLSWQHQASINFLAHTYTLVTNVNASLSYFSKPLLRRPQQQQRQRERRQTKGLKALVNEDTLLRTHCCLWCFFDHNFYWRIYYIIRRSSSMNNNRS